MTWCQLLITHAHKLPSGAQDSRAVEKWRQEYAEYKDFMNRFQNDPNSNYRRKYSASALIPAILEAADMAYYAAKAVYANKWTLLEAEESIEECAEELNEVADFHIGFATIILVANAKYRLRAQPGNPKNDANERATAGEVLHNTNDTGAALSLMEAIADEIYSPDDDETPVLWKEVNLIAEAAGLQELESTSDAILSILTDKSDLREYSYGALRSAWYKQLRKEQPTP